MSRSMEPTVLGPGLGIGEGDALCAAINLANSATVRIDPETGELSGPAPDLARAIAEELGCPCVFTGYPSANAVLTAIDNGGWHLSFLAIDQSRYDVLAFSTPFATVEATLMVPESLAIDSLSEMDRSGIIIAAVAKSAYARVLARQLVHARVKEFETRDEALFSVEQGLSDCAAGLRPALTDFCAAHSGFRTLKTSFHEIKQAIAVRKSAEGIVHELNRIIASRQG